MFYICSSRFVTHRKDGSSKMSDGSRVKPKRVQVLPVASETPAYNHYEKGWLSQIKSKFLPVSEKRKAKPLSRAQKIDMASRILFPFLYVVYNTVYWYIYLNGVEILAWDVCIYIILVIIYFYNCYIRNYQKQYWVNKANTEQGIIYEVRVETLILLFSTFIFTFHSMHSGVWT